MSRRYPNGEFIDRAGPIHQLPEGIRGLEPARQERDLRVRDDDLVEGRKSVEVSFGSSEARPREPTHYSTTIRNVSDIPVKVLRFGGFERDRPDEWKLLTATGDVYSAEQFREWYGQPDEWLAPGETATDPNNYGGPSMLWAYFCETKDGKQFVAGGVKR